MGASCLVICHGTSEKIIADCIKSTLRLPMEVYAEKNGKQGRGCCKSIQISGLEKLLTSNLKFKTMTGFLKAFSKVECSGKGKMKILENFKIFIVMDVDDCTKEEKNSFINGNMFKKHWANEYIIPIFNEKNLEDVIKGSNLAYDNIKNKTQEYLELFPRGAATKSDLLVQAGKLTKCKQTNLEELLNYCLYYK